MKGMILYGFILYSNRSRNNTSPGIFSDKPKKKKKKSTFDPPPPRQSFSLALAVLSSDSRDLPAPASPMLQSPPSKKNALLILQVRTLEPGGSDACL